MAEDLQTILGQLQSWERLVAIKKKLVSKEKDEPRRRSGHVALSIRTADESISREGFGSNAHTPGRVMEMTSELFPDADKIGASPELSTMANPGVMRLRSNDDALPEVRTNVIIGSSPALKTALNLVSLVAPTNCSVLILGETGTGKELVARALHNLSGRQDRAFVKLNCAAIPIGLLESELFGHEKGAFTGAIARKTGRFELADKGTLFLDEVGDIPVELQAKLLRVLQEQEFERLGGNHTHKVDVRLIAATHRNLALMVRKGVFREDLYYRLKVFPIQLPALRQRTEDIPKLVWQFTSLYARRMNKKIDEIPVETMEALVRYPWPGNIRELQNFIERAVILSPLAVLRAPTFEFEPLHTNGGSSTSILGLKEVERDHIVRALEMSDWIVGGRNGAAQLLGMRRTSLVYRMQKLGIFRPTHPPADAASH